MTEATTEVQTKGTVIYDAGSAIVLGNSARGALASAKDLIIDSPEMYQLAGNELAEIKALQNRVEESRTAITKPMNAALKAVNDLFRAPAQFLADAETVCKQAMLAYTEAEERKAAQARREAEQRQREERERLQADQRRMEEEARTAQEASAALRRKALEAAETGDLGAAAAARQEADERQASAVAASEVAHSIALESQIVTIAPTHAPPAKLAGTAIRMTYSAEVVDLGGLIRAVAAGDAPIEAICADMKFLNAQAKAYKSSGDHLYGGSVKIVGTRNIAQRAA